MRRDFAQQVADVLHGPAFRAYTGDDMLGAELGGAMKNVLAVATGVADGMQLGLNARAGLITRGLNEMLRLNPAIGGKAETLMGLAGLGDLVLTCTGDLSRNRRLGLALGRGQSLEDAVREIGQVVESVQTADEVMRQAERHGIELPISSAVQRCCTARSRRPKACASCWRASRSRNTPTACSADPSIIWFARNKRARRKPGFLFVTLIASDRQKLARRPRLLPEIVEEFHLTRPPSARQQRGEAECANLHGNCSIVCPCRPSWQPRKLDRVSKVAASKNRKSPAKAGLL